MDIVCLKMTDTIGDTEVDVFSFLPQYLSICHLLVGLRLELWAGQSSLSTPILANHVFMELFVHAGTVLGPLSSSAEKLQCFFVISDITLGKNNISILQDFVHIVNYYM